jgi:uncharacterized protein
MTPSTAEIVAQACNRIPPLWPLKHFIAVNPFVGLSDRPFVEASSLMRMVGHGDILAPADYYAEQIASGRIREADFLEAMTIAAKTLPPKWSRRLNCESFKAFNEALTSPIGDPSESRILSFAEFLDAQVGGPWATFVVEEISKWCSAYFDQGQSSWRMPWQRLGLFAAWKAAAQWDANPEWMGLKGFRTFVAALPANHLNSISDALTALGIPEDARGDFLHRQLMSVPGWSGYVQYLVREKGMAGQADDSLAQLLAIRLAYDLALWRCFGDDENLVSKWRDRVAGLSQSGGKVSPDLLVRFVAQQALECGYQRELIGKLKGNKRRTAKSGRKTLQAIFCIDVRSEILRRSLEAQSKDIDTIGFAGFFGVAVEYLKLGRDEGGGARCPVLLSPKIRVREELRHAGEAGEGWSLSRLRFRQTVNATWNAFKNSAISCFSFVETSGLWFGVKLTKQTLGFTGPEAAFAADCGHHAVGPRLEWEDRGAEDSACRSSTGIPTSDQVELAASALKNMGLVADFAEVVLICGHGSATVNNPYGSALDCGACGGHPGDVNARIAATILNQPTVREGLIGRGIRIPDDTVFIAGLHNTTTDEVLIYDEDAIPPGRSAVLEEVKGWLVAASRRARRERAPLLGLADGSDGDLEDGVRGRSRDWAQVRPEWGLAGNAALIAAPRERTKDLNLGGRIFLHNYDPALDPDKSTLELILVAPMVVASWINLQYYGSTVNNRLFGSGNKVLHNVVGAFGVWQGNGGDLQPGLPLQSLHDGRRWIHEPLRLSVFVQADPAAIKAIIAKQPGVRDLVENGWVTLFAMDDSGQRFWRYCGNQFVGEAP